jgi:Fe-S-cluster containining protein
MSQVNEFRLEMPPHSPVVPVQLWEQDKLRFRCHQGIACFNKCCESADIVLTPWDIVRMARHFGVTTREAIDRYTADFDIDGQGMPGLKLARKEGSTACLHLGPGGCGIYPDRPVACRYYPLGSVALRRKDASAVEDSYFVVKEAHCLGHGEPHEQTIAEYRREQGIERYDEANREWRDIVLKKRSSGPAVGAPPARSFELFFLASYDLDGFRRFALSDGFDSTYEIEPETREAIASDDAACLKFAMRFLRQALFGELTVKVRDDAAERRRRAYRERREREIREKAAQLAEQQDQMYDSLKEQGW